MCVHVTVGWAEVVQRRPELAAAHFSRNLIQMVNTAVNQKGRDNRAGERQRGIELQSEVEVNPTCVAHV